MVEHLDLGKIDTPEFLDTLHRVLGNSKRRYILRYLLTSPQPVSLHRLAIETAASEHDVSVEAVTTDQLEDGLLRLKHVHLPMLHDTGLVTWDRDDDLISRTPLMDHLPATESLSGGVLDLSISDRSRAP